MNKFIQKIHLKKGALKKELGIPLNRKIPKSLLNKIIVSGPGKTISNPSRLGKRRIHITRKLEKRAFFAQELKSLRRK